MRRRRLMLALVALALLAGAGAVAWTVFRSRPYITFEQARRIQVGMTLEEVVAALGRPPTGAFDVDEDVMPDLFTGLVAEVPEDGSAHWFADYEPPQIDVAGQLLHHGLDIKVGFD